jgi:uncharacterized protein
MMHFAVICRDKPGALQTRIENRPAHLAYIGESGVVELAGPLIEGGQPVGSLLILNVENAEMAREWADSDPYMRAGLFRHVEIVEWKKVIG